MVRTRLLLALVLVLLAPGVTGCGFLDDEPGNALGVGDVVLDLDRPARVEPTDAAEIGRAQVWLPDATYELTLRGPVDSATLADSGGHLVTGHRIDILLLDWTRSDPYGLDYGQFLAPPLEDRPSTHLTLRPADLPPVPVPLPTSPLERDVPLAIGVVRGTVGDLRLDVEYDGLVQSVTLTSGFVDAGPAGDLDVVAQSTTGETLSAQEYVRSGDVGMYSSATVFDPRLTPYHPDLGWPPEGRWWLVFGVRTSLGSALWDPDGDRRGTPLRSRSLRRHVGVGSYGPTLVDPHPDRETGVPGLQHVIAVPAHAAPAVRIDLATRVSGGPLEAPLEVRHTVDLRVPLPVDPTREAG